MKKVFSVWFYGTQGGLYSSPIVFPEQKYVDQHIEHIKATCEEPIDVTLHSIHEYPSNLKVQIANLLGKLVGVYKIVYTNRIEDKVAWIFINQIGVFDSDLD